MEHFGDGRLQFGKLPLSDQDSQSDENFLDSAPELCPEVGDGVKG
jgi:hypothetical protein